MFIASNRQNNEIINFERYESKNVTIDYARSKYKGTGAGKSQKDRM